MRVLRQEGECFYDTQAASLEAKPYPTLDAIRNVFALALKRDPEIKSFNPLALWDLHYLREIDDTGSTREGSLLSKADVEDRF